jgi:pyrimidine-nucleoside phosphorylase
VIDVVNDLIAWKRDGRRLDPARMDAFVRGVLDGAVAPYQASALLMAMVLRGLDEDEALALTRAMIETGKTMDLSAVGRPVLDKHSSGGVGDKVTLVLAPLVAACGAVFGKMSGRGLGHTGGTLDKLESIPGFRVQLSHGELLRQLERIGVAVVGQSDRIVPADKVLYALRDVTATVDEPGLIAASIMAKKVASGTTAVALDLKVGGGAFMKDQASAAALGRLCGRIGEALGRRVSVVYSTMDQPLGLAVGNRLEVEEAWQVLCGEGPADVRALTLELAALLLSLSDLGVDEPEARRRVVEALESGRAAEQFDRWCFVQGGRWKPGEYHRLAVAEVRAQESGWIARCDAALVGRAAQLAGAGRQQAADRVDPAAGVVVARKIGDEVEAGGLLATVFARHAGRRREAHAVLADAFAVSAEAVPAPALLLGRAAAAEESAPGADSGAKDAAAAGGTP